MGFFDFFKRKQPAKQAAKRSFAAAGRSRFTEWLNSTFSKINYDIWAQLQDLITKSRDLAKNNSIFRSHLGNVQGAVIGKSGFQLQVLARRQDGEIDRALSDLVQWKWYEFQQASNGWLTTDRQTGGVAFDALILRTLLIDGQAFVRVIKDPTSPFGVRFRLLDSLTIDTLKKQLSAPGQNAIICGVQVDQDQRPVAYWIRPGDQLIYQTREVQRIPASEVIHLYHKEFPGQARGFPPVCAALNSLKQLDDYKQAELYAAKLNACVNVFYQRNSDPAAGGFLGAQSSDGTFIQTLSPGQASIVPDGYTVKNPTNNHPNVNFGGFVKQICREVASSMGCSYNRLLRDYSDVNYSSLREATIDEMQVWQAWQQYLIQNWKMRQLRIWLTAAAETGDWLKPSDAMRVLRGANFLCAKRVWFDVSKQITATEKQLALGLKNPLQVIDENGLDPDQVLDGWSRWNSMCSEHGLKFPAEDAKNENVQETGSEDGDGAAGGGADGASVDDLH